MVGRVGTVPEVDRIPGFIAVLDGLNERDAGYSILIPRKYSLYLWRSSQTVSSRQVDHSNM